MDEANLEERLFFVEAIEAIEQQMGFYVSELKSIKEADFKVPVRRKNYLEPVKMPSILSRLGTVSKELMRVYSIRGKLTERYMRVPEIIYRFEPQITDKDMLLNAIKSEFTVDNFNEARENVTVNSGEMLALLMNIQSDRSFASSQYKGEVDRLRGRKKILSIEGSYVVPLSYDLTVQYVANRRQGRSLLKQMGFLT